MLGLRIVRRINDEDEMVIKETRIFSKRQ